MMLAEISQGEIWSVVCSVAGTVISLIALLVIAFKKTEMQLSPQPLIVAMEKEFVTHRTFDAAISGNEQTHRDLFAKLVGVERGAREAMQKEIAIINEDRRRTMEKLNERNERIMFALGKIAEAQGIDISPTQ
jgi:hypothetical protein